MIKEAIIKIVTKEDLTYDEAYAVIMLQLPQAQVRL